MVLDKAIGVLSTYVCEYHAINIFGMSKASRWSINLRDQWIFMRRKKKNSWGGKKNETKCSMKILRGVQLVISMILTSV